MDFFEQQDRARRNSARLILLMVLAVVSLIALTSLALVLVWQFLGGNLFSNGIASGLWQLVGLVSLLVIAVVLCGSLYKHFSLSSGGRAVAEQLGGRLASLQPRDLAEQRLLNVVEEMALAAGIPVPPVYVLDDSAINAFAAGLTPRDAVIGITRGALLSLTREELQGVIAHEFSHILHGDMRLNTQLVSVLHGILLLGLIGGFLLRSLGRGRVRSSSRDSGGGLLLVMGIGVTLLVVGYAGTFFGNLIKAAVSRQREFLADAAAVQFTRNPDGIAGALKRIGGNLSGSQLQSPNAAEFSHMYFGQGVPLLLEGLMATHPPLVARIRRIQPHWDGHFPPPSFDPAALLAAAQPAGPASSSAFAPQAALEAIAAIGTPTAAHLQQARAQLQSLPQSLHNAAHSCVEAQMLLAGLLLAPDASLRQAQLERLRPQLDLALHAALDRHLPALLELPAELRLPLLELSLPALKQLGSGEQLLLRRLLATLILHDGQVSLMEWSLLRIVERNLSGPRPIDGRHHLVELADESALLLSALAHAGHSDASAAAAAFAAACTQLPFHDLQLQEATAFEPRQLDAALQRLNRLWPLQKPRLLKAMALCVAHDGRIAVAEAELMRAVADSLDCPLPPLLG